mmetsp:Transcript_14527/g.37282  ORF Transcript_14527/g.37282 Transcript_14527/m.37282 type:complete len:103 (+) Transcript_14527:801-1109(+)
MPRPAGGSGLKAEDARTLADDPLMAAQAADAEAGHGAAAEAQAEAAVVEMPRPVIALLSEWALMTCAPDTPLDGTPELLLRVTGVERVEGRAPERQSSAGTG